MAVNLLWYYYVIILLCYYIVIQLKLSLNRKGILMKIKPNMMNILICLIVVIPLNLYGTKKVITLGFNNIENFPYLMGFGKDLASPPGIAIDLLDAVAKEVGIEIRYLRFPGKRVLAYIEDGTVDGGFIFSHKKAREKVGRYPFKNGKIDVDKRFTYLTYCFYVNKNRSQLSWDGKKLHNSINPVGANLGYSIVKDLEKMGFKVNEVRTLAQNIDMLQKNRIDAYAAQDIVADHYIEMHKINYLKKLSPSIKTKPYFLIFNHKFYEKHTQLANKVWDSIANKRDEVTKSVTKKYL